MQIIGYLAVWGLEARSSLVSAMAANPDVVEKDLARLRRQMEAGRCGWVVEEGCGRCLRALGREDEAKRHLRRSLDRPEPEEHWQWLALGAIYRMLGDDAQAQECWGRAVTAIGADGRPEIDRGRLVEAHFLSGRDDEALELARAIDSNRLTRAAGVRMLAEARQAGDPELAQQAANWFADRIRREREKVSATGMVSLHDWHEIASKLAEELTSSA